MKRITQMTITPEGEPIFCEAAITLKIEDEAAGEYLKIIQCCDDMEAGVVAINPDEWPELREAIDEMMNEIAKHERKTE